MSITLRDLRYFLAVADVGHFGRAARACFVSQPTLSAGIHRLERVLGVRLFERTNRSVMISSAGAAILDDARALVRGAEDLRGRAQDLHDPLSGAFRLGVIPTIGPYLLSHLVPVIKAHLTDLSLRLHERLTEDLLADLQRGILDAALLSDPFETRGLSTAVLFDEEFVLALPDGHRLCQGNTVSHDELKGLELLLLAEGHCMREQVVEICGEADRDTRDAYGGSSLETLRSMVAAGAGCTLLPTLAAQPDRAGRGVTLRPLSGPAPYRRISLAWRTTFPRTSLIDRVVELARMCADERGLSVLG